MDFFAFTAFIKNKHGGAKSMFSINHFSEFEVSGDFFSWNFMLRTKKGGNSK